MWTAWSVQRVWRPDDCFLPRPNHNLGPAVSLRGDRSGVMSGGGQRTVGSLKAAMQSERRNEQLEVRLSADERSRSLRRVAADIERFGLFAQGCWERAAIRLSSAFEEA